MAVGSLNVESESYLAHIVRENLKQQSNMATAKGANGFVQRPDQRPEIFLCRDPSVFQFIVNYLRNGSRVNLPVTAENETLQRLMKEAEFYQLHGLVPLIWRTMRGIPLILPPLQVDQEVCWNPGTFSLYWRSVAVMTQCYAPRRAHYQVIGFMKSAYQLTNDSTWWCYDVRCPACSSFDFAPVEDGVDFVSAEAPTKSALQTSRGKIRKLCDHACALVDWDQGWRFHVPVSALLPSAMTSMM